MSLVSTLAKVAIGVAVAKGVSSMMKGSSGTAAGAGLPSGTGLEDMMGNILSGAGTGSTQTGSTPTGQTSRGPAGGLGGLLEDLAGGSLSSGPSSGGGGFDDLLNSLGAGTTTRQAGAAPAPGGGLEDILGGLLGGGAAAGAGGGLGELLGGLLGGAPSGAAPAQAERVTQHPANPITPNRRPGFGQALNRSIGQHGRADADEPPPTPAQNAAAGILLLAMVQAAKSDGRIDAAEKRMLLGKLEDASPQERAFVEKAMDAPVDVGALVRAVPRGMGPQVYAMSLVGIDLDSQAEAKYLDALARGLGLDQPAVNAIHARMGEPPLYA